MSAKWKGTIILGLVGNNPNTPHFPSSAILLRRPCWIVTQDYLNMNGNKIQSKLGESLSRIQAGTIITMILNHSGSLLIKIGEKCLEEIPTGHSNHLYPVFDLYGRCEKISIVNSDPRNASPIHEEGGMSALNTPLRGFDRSVPQREKADLEVHEKETENSLPSLTNGSNLM